jgi:hypothetical protein
MNLTKDVVNIYRNVTMKPLYNCYLLIKILKNINLN